jgi:hypothetical protein
LEPQANKPFAKTFDKSLPANAIAKKPTSLTTSSGGSSDKSTGSAINSNPPLSPRTDRINNMRTPMQKRPSQADFDALSEVLVTPVTAVKETKEDVQAKEKGALLLLVVTFFWIVT